MMSLTKTKQNILIKKLCLRFILKSVPTHCISKYIKFSKCLIGINRLIKIKE